jgi:multiple sugar transport system substrate-binding protein
MFKKAGVAEPDGSWTWDDFDAAAKKLTAAEGKPSVYEHTWQSTTQGFASAQAGGDIFSGDLGYMKPYYEDRLARTAAGTEIAYNTAKANKLTYQAEFGKQDVAMMPMGSWYVATLISQQASGDANSFAWGIAPIPQLHASTTGTSKTPVTFGDPTGFGINAAIDSSKVAVAKEFLAYAASPEAAKVLAGIGITPALTDKAVASVFFGVKGAPTDELSKFAWSTHKTLPENPTNGDTAAVQTILGTAHDAILSGAQSVDAALKSASSQIKAAVK